MSGNFSPELCDGPAKGRVRDARMVSEKILCLAHCLHEHFLALQRQTIDAVRLREMHRTTHQQGGRLAER